MRRARLMPSGTSERMSELLRSSSVSGEIRHIQCIYFRSKFGYTSKQIGEMVGYNDRTVRDIQSEYFKHGEAAIRLKTKGGRYRSNMSLDQETAFIEPFLEKAKAGGILEISKVHQAYEKKLGREIKKSVVYALLHRHGWRKIAPRPRHPDTDSAAQEAFKKTGP